MMENNSETLKRLIEQRRSIYPAQYKEGEIEPQVLFEILNAANYAPNHKKTKPWRLRVFEGIDKEQLAVEMASLYKQYVAKEDFSEKKYDAILEKINKSAAIVTISVNFSGLVPEWEEIAAVAMGVQNMYLTCTAHRLGCYWSSPKFSEHLSNFLKLDDNQKCLGLFYIGIVENQEGL